MRKKLEGKTVHSPEVISVPNYSKMLIHQQTLGSKSKNSDLSDPIDDQNFSDKLSFALQSKNQSELDNVVNFFNKKTGYEVWREKCGSLTVTINSRKGSLEKNYQKYLNPLLRVFEEELHISRESHKFFLSIDSSLEDTQFFSRLFGKQVLKIYIKLTDRNSLNINHKIFELFPEVTSILISQLNNDNKFLIDNLCNFNNLQHLMIDGVSKLKSISLIEHQNLKTLFVRSCRNLLDIKIHACQSLESIEVHSCDKLIKFHIKKSPSLVNFVIFQCSSISNLPFKCIQNIRTLTISSLKSLRSISRIAKLTSLEEFHFSGLTKVRRLVLKDLHLLNKITIDSSSINQLNINNLKNLKSLMIIKSHLKIISTKKVPELERVNINLCGKLHKFTISHASKISELCLSVCGKLQKVTGLTFLSQLICLDIYKCPDIRNISTKGMKSLEEFRVEVCRRLQSLTFSSCNPLKSIKIDLCKSLERITGLDKLSELENLKITRCKTLQSVRIGGRYEDKEVQIHVEVKSKKS